MRHLCHPFARIIAFRSPSGSTSLVVRALKAASLRAVEKGSCSTASASMLCVRGGVGGDLSGRHYGISARCRLVRDIENLDIGSSVPYFAVKPQKTRDVECRCVSMPSPCFILLARCASLVHAVNKWTTNTSTAPSRASAPSSPVIRTNRLTTYLHRYIVSAGSSNMHI
ncbi:hypothetical protein DENSPDRAFT_836470 [Dentipellis sp. KUC8613]|nr:hypothetical protein DENSPDRAFT_836470 [Dentipellis sp. KUC8613]